jgi:hypothetical protein
MTVFWVVLQLRPVKLIALRMEASSSSEASMNYIRLHGATTQMRVIFIRILCLLTVHKN